MPVEPEIVSQSPGRPVVSETVRTPTGSEFRIVFQPGQQLPPHQNAMRVVITAVAGSGVLTIGVDDDRRLQAGDAVRLEPNVLHAVTAGGDGLELLVVRTVSCCGVC